MSFKCPLERDFFPFFYSLVWPLSWSISRYCKVGLALYKLEHHRECNVLFGCNCDVFSKASIHQNELQLITFLMLQWTLGLIRGSYLQWLTHSCLDMTFSSECYWNKHMFMNKYMCFYYQNLFCVTGFSKHSLCWLLISTSLNIFWVE